MLLLIQPYCYDPTLITEPKTFHIQSISILLGMKAPAIRAGSQAFPYHCHLKSAPPQMPVPDMDIKGGIFSGKVIIVDHEILTPAPLDRNQGEFLYATTQGKITF